MAAALIGPATLGAAYDYGEPPVPSEMDRIRQQSLLENKIYDDGLLRYDLIQAKIDHCGGVDADNDAHDWFNELLEDSVGDPGLMATNGGTMRLFNFDILVGDVANPQEVSALVIGVQMAEGTYAISVEPLQMLHEWLLNKYDVSPDTASNRLDRLVGEMRPLAPEVLDIQETYVLLGRPPGELFEGDPGYWSGVGSYGNCVLIEKGGDCQHHLTALKERPPED